jgi:two-component system, response regulator FlrC
MTKPIIMVVEDDHALREALEDTLMLSNYQIAAFESAESAIAQILKINPDIIVSDINLPGLSGVEFLRFVKQRFPGIPVVLMTAYAEINAAVEALKEGAADYIQKPFAPEALLNTLVRFLPQSDDDFCSPIAEDEASKQVFQIASKVAPTDVNVMLTGPSGTGKEVVSRYIHRHSNRRDNDFIAINCAAIPDNMLESILFGYEKGAFTGATQSSPGKFEQAQDGTLLLDEISEMDLSLQAKLLRVLQEQEVERLGSHKTIALNVRVIATSNRNLFAEVQQGKFREDLYYRLNVFPIKLLPLRERRNDIYPIAKALLAKHARKMQVNIPNISIPARDRLEEYSWPGNVRELENVLQRALILNTEDSLSASSLHFENTENLSDLTPPTGQTYFPQSQPQNHSANDIEHDPKLGDYVRNKEFQVILSALDQFSGSRKKVAENLGISPRTLRYKMAKMRDLGIKIPA